MQEIINYATGLGLNQVGIDFIKGSYKPEHKLGEWEHTVDFLIHKNYETLEWAGFDILKKKAHKWVDKMSRSVSHFEEVDGEDFEVVMDFGDGFRFVKLLSKDAYTREGSLMSHCVGSYFGRDVEIFSLRDINNKPHCTIEKDRQIKGKGNGDIHPRYIEYVVKFLESQGMKVRDSEMENLGYRVEPFLEYCTSELFRGKYIRKNVKAEYISTVKVYKRIKAAVKYKGDKIVLFDGDINFDDYDISSLGNLTLIRGSADFSNSKITDLGQLTSIGRDADFSNSKITDLGQLTSIGGGCLFQWFKNH